MATNAQRTQAICDGLLNRVSTQAEQLLLAEALYDDAELGVPFADLTNAQKAAIIPTALFRYGRGKVRQLRKKQADAGIPDDFPL